MLPLQQFNLFDDSTCPFSKSKGQITTPLGNFIVRHYLQNQGMNRRPCLELGGNRRIAGLIFGRRGFRFEARIMNTRQLCFEVGSLIIGLVFLIFPKPIWVGFCRFCKFTWSEDEEDFFYVMRRDTWKKFYGMTPDDLDESKTPKIFNLIGALFLILTVVFVVLSIVFRNSK